MIPLLLGAMTVGATVVGGFFIATARERRHQAIRRHPFPSAWEEHLERNVKFYPLLSAELAAELRDNIQIFLSEKSFEGCGGLKVTDEMRVTVAALACILLLNRRTSHYKDLTTILMYPKAYVVTGPSSDGISITDTEQGRLGESWIHGTVVLSWNDVTNTAHNIKDGHNLVLHEFAHQLDQEDGRGDGVPIFEQESQYTTWAEVMSPEFEKLKKATRKGKKSVLRAYGATNPAEFFAVATETFFEKPQQLKAKHPAMYHELSDYYQLDPANWGVPETL